MKQLSHALGFLVAITIAGCAKPPAAAVKAGPPDVLIEAAVSRPVTDYEDFTGHTEAYKVVDVRPEITGKLKTVYFKDGDFVHKGDPLFEIDDVLYKATMKKAEADVAKSKADIANWKAQIQLSKAELKRAETAFMQMAAAQTDVDKAQASLDVGIAQLAAAGASLDATEANLDTARIHYGYTTIRAAYSGRMSRRMVDPGNIVKENETTLTRLVVLDPIYVSFDIDERTVLMFRKLIQAGKIASSRDAKLEVKVGLADDDDYSLKAILTFADNQLDLNTGTLRFRAEMPNTPLQFRPLPALVGIPAAVGSEQTGLKLLSPGMFVRVRLPVGKEHAGVLISEEALGSDQGKRFVYVLNKDNEAELRHVKPGPQDGKFRVIDEGLASGERVIVSGLQRVRPNMKVNPKLRDQKK